VPVSIKGTGGGSVTLSAAAAATDTTLTLPNTTGTVALIASPTFSGTLTATTITSPASTALTIQSAGTTAMTVNTSQNVGIGTTSPTVKLDVNGILKCLLTDSQTASGYTKLPNGVYIQWGNSAASTSGVTTSFPIAFPTACWIVVGTNSNQSNPPAPSISSTSSNFTMTVSAGSPNVNWFAVGY